MEKDYIQILLDSITQVVEAKIHNSKYNEVIEATIIENYNRDNGIYKIDYNGNRLEAEPFEESNQNYNLQDRVYVNKIQNNGVNKYLILGKKITSDNMPIKLADPFVNYIRFENTQKINNLPFSWTLAEAKKADIITLALDSSLNGDKERFVIEFTITTGSNNKHQFSLTEEDFLGSLDFTEQIVRYGKLEVSNIGEIKKIEIKSNDNSRLNIVSGGDSFIELGRIIQPDMEDTVYIYSKDEKYDYTTLNGISQNNEKTLELQYTYKEDKTDSYVSLTSISVEKDKNGVSAIPNCEVSWERKEPNKESWQTIIDANNRFSISQTLLSGVNKEEFRAKITRINLETQALETLYSNTLTFVNNIQDENLVNSIKIELADNSNGFYPLWYPDGFYSLEKEAEFERLRIATIDIDSSLSLVELFDYVQEIKWDCPDFILPLGGDETTSIKRPDNIIDEIMKEDWMKKNLSLSYRINRNKQILIQGTNETLSCEIIFKDNFKKVSASRVFTFLPIYSDIENNIIVRLLDKDGIPVSNINNDANVEDPEKYQIEIKMFDLDGKELIFSIDSISFNSDTISEILEKDGAYSYIPKSFALDENVGFYDVLEIKIKNNNITYKKYYPISWADKDLNQIYYSGPKEIVYDNTGKNPRFKDDYLKVYKDNELVQGKWDIKIDSKDVYSGAYPRLEVDKIIPTNYYESNLGGKYSCCLRFFVENKEAPVYIQPLVIRQQLYFSPLIDNWDGNYKVTKEGIVMSSALIAGTKNQYNEFTGIVAGELSKVEGETESTPLSRSQKTGVFGYHDGVQSYGFKADGTAFIGKSGSGRIDFDGNNAVIKNGAATMNKGDIYSTGGMIIDLNETKSGSDGIGGLHTPKAAIMPDGILYADNAHIIGEITAETGSIGAWSIGTIPNTDENNKPIWGNAAYVNSLYSISQAEDEEGNLNDYLTFLRVPATSEGHVFSVRVRNPEGKVTTPFSLAKNGHLIAESAEIKGDIRATSGEIGSLRISDGLVGYDAVEDMETFSLTGDGLSITDSTASIQVGNLSITTNNNGTTTTLQAEGPLFIRGTTMKDGEAWAASSIELMNDDGLNRVEADITLEVYQKDNNFVYGRLKASKSLYYTTYYTIYGRVCQDHVMNNDDNIIARKITLPAGETYSASYGFGAYSYNIFGGDIYYQLGLSKQNVKNAPKKKVSTLSTSWEYCLDVDHIAQRQPSNNIKITGHLIPKANGYNLGAAEQYRWNQGWFNEVYNASGEIKTSDLHKKNSIGQLPDDYNIIFDSLKPVIFKYNDGRSDRFHSGFIAQDVKEAILQSGLTTKDFAAYCEWVDSDGNTSCGLRYSEFIALCVDEIQKLKKRVFELECQQ